MSTTTFVRLPSLSLVFGMTWLPVLGANAGRAARRVARRHRATHWVAGKGFACSVGLAQFRRRPSHGKRSLYSAAQCLAGMYPSGTFAALLHLEDIHRWWLVAVHEGAVVVRTDSLHLSEDEARSALDELRPAFPSLVLLGQAGGSAAPSLAELAAAGGKAARLSRAGRGAFGLPWPAWCLLCLGLLWALHGWINGRAGSSTPDAVRMSPAEAERAWRQAIREAARSNPVHGATGLLAVLEGFYRLPVSLEGWRLAKASCRPAGMVWHCQADYRRHDRAASNAALLKAAPMAWRVGFPSMEAAEVKWSAAAVAQSFDQAALHSTLHNQRHLWSDLQAVRPAFTTLHLGPSARIPIRQPQDGQGQAVPRPPGVLDYAARPLRAEGPLRSMVLLLPQAESFGWQSVTLSLHGPRDVDLRTSRLHVSLHGALYEIHSPAESGATAEQALD